MRNILVTAGLLVAVLGWGCGDSSPSRPTRATTTTSVPPPPPFEIETLLTVYRNANADAQWTQTTMTDEDLAETILGVEELEVGSTNLNNELGRFQLQEAIDRINEEFTDEDFVTAFDESRENLRRFLNDADNDGWSIDGRHGVDRDWPHDQELGPQFWGNDPDGWTAQIIVTVRRP